MLEDIQVFCAIAKHQSFSKAARELNISAPVITRRLSRLEKTLSARLLNRTTRQVTLTEAGNKFYVEVTDILQLLDASKENIKNTTSQIAGTLKVAMPSSLSQSYVAPALNDFLGKYPHLKIQIFTGNHLLNLLHEGFDLVIHCGELPNSNYYARKIATMKKVICASPDYLNKHGEPKELEDFKNHNCLQFYENIVYPWSVYIDGKIKEIQVNGNVVVNNSIELRTLATNAVGIAYLPAYFVHDELVNGKLVSILDKYQLPDYNLYAVYSTKEYLAKKTIVFMDFITELLKEVIDYKSNVSTVTRES
ncbi:MAG: LysR family transcriptional regulator [Gammaproteobacteria bacterium]|nr:LysR family transcriptional regulator [Gammaproteobacteria bacterium]